MRSAARREEQKLTRLKTLFDGCRFFLSREVPREALTFIIRSHHTTHPTPCYIEGENEHRMLKIPLVGILIIFNMKTVYAKL